MNIHSKRISELIGLLLFMAFCASLAYWSTQWLIPKQRAVTPAASMPMTQIDPTLAAGLFGGEQQAAAIAGNYKLMGIVAAKDDIDSVAIVSVDGKPAHAFRAGTEIRDGARISAIHPSYVVLSVGGLDQRIALPENTLHIAVLPVAVQEPAPDKKAGDRRQAQ